MFYMLALTFATTSVLAQMGMDMGASNSTTIAPFCVTQPWASNCTDYSYPTDMIKADNDDLCKQMDFMTGCSIQKQCSANPSLLGDSSFCKPLSILADTCSADGTMNKMRGCKNYVSMCGPSNSTVKQCTIGPLASLPTTESVNKAVRSICTSHTMDGCEKCTFASPTAYGNCDLLAVYSSLCIAMPNMNECSDWNKMCTANNASKLYSLCGGDSMTTPPVMKMYFHNEVTYVLFYGWVPRTGGQYAGSFFLLLAFAILVEGLLATRPQIERYLLKELVEGRYKTIKDEKFDYKTLFYTRTTILYTPLLFLLRAADVLVGYLLMLAAMSFNVIIFTAVIVGLALGHVIFLPYKLSSNVKEEESATACCN